MLNTWLVWNIIRDKPINIIPDQTGEIVAMAGVVAAKMKAKKQREVDEEAKVL